MPPKIAGTPLEVTDSQPAVTARSSSTPPTALLPKPDAPEPRVVPTQPATSNAHASPVATSAFTPMPPPSPSLTVPPTRPADPKTPSVSATPPAPVAQYQTAPVTFPVSPPSRTGVAVTAVPPPWLESILALTVTGDERMAVLVSAMAALAKEQAPAEGHRMESPGQSREDVENRIRAAEERVRAEFQVREERLARRMRNARVNRRPKPG
ncbi:hypothetical protein BDK51DRAFT_30952 [Blyttiomyces helicus]|uniref:Uncharacterized protein n=1 Tax=Blyttiomyces helicus TaxID=388810 RepID=A0A4P9WCE2_9FUNG|nr:hypothetical protein BDK51DRAFT_30952 [Blyttiomyces helicus]|eukprot:RKO88560.1 hypothetical protein BDK51DRAFT_30952 [Blyttiomyces helicus]